MGSLNSAKMQALPLLLLITTPAHYQTCNPTEKKEEQICDFQDQTVLVIVLSVLLSLCVFVLVLCGCVWLCMYRKQRTIVENKDENPDYGEEDEDYQSRVVDNNYYYD